MMIKDVIILNDHPIFSFGLKKVINEDPSFVVKDICKTSAELMSALSFGSADILLIDCSRPIGETSVRTLVEQLHEKWPHIALVLLGESEHHQQIATVCSDKVKDYFCKTFTPESYLLGLHRIARKLDRESKTNNVPCPSARSADFSSQPLSAKEKKIIKYIYSGLSVTETAHHVNRSIKTISAQKRNAMKKLGIKNDRDIYSLNIQAL